MYHSLKSDSVVSETLNAYNKLLNNKVFFSHSRESPYKDAEASRSTYVMYATCTYFNNNEPILCI